MLRELQTVQKYNYTPKLQLCSTVRGLTAPETAFHAVQACSLVQPEMSSINHSSGLPLQWCETASNKLLVRFRFYGMA